MDNLRDDDRDLGQRGDENVGKGGMDKVTGKVQEGWGKLTGDKSTEAEGKMRQVGGSVREGVGNVERNVDDTMDDMRDRASDRDREYDSENPL
ncbi:MAG TPA: CsbD family protein [Ktedonobacterales bacterium]